MGCKPERIAEPPKDNICFVALVRFAVDEVVAFVEAFQDADDPLWMHLFYPIAVVATDQVMLLCSADDPMALTSSFIASSSEFARMWLA